MGVNIIIGWADIKCLLPKPWRFILDKIIGSMRFLVQNYSVPYAFHVTCRRYPNNNKFLENKYIRFIVLGMRKSSRNIIKSLLSLNERI